VINAVTAKDAEGHIAAVDLEDESGKVIVAADKQITEAAAKSLAKVEKQVTWPVRAKVTNKIEYLDASEEESSVIAGAGSEIDENGHFVADRVSARLHLRSSEVDSDDVNYMDAARNQIIGSSAGLIPFIEKNYVYRSLMGSNQQRQAV